MDSVSLSWAEHHTSASDPTLYQAGRQGNSVPDGDSDFDHCYFVIFAGLSGRVQKRVAWL